MNLRAHIQTKKWYQSLHKHLDRLVKNLHCNLARASNKIAILAVQLTNNRSLKVVRFTGIFHDVNC